MFLSSLPEGPGSFPYVLFITVEVVTLVAIYDSTFVVLGVLVLGLHSYLFDGSVTLEMHLYGILTTYLFDAFGYSLCVWNDNLSYCGLVSPVVAVWIVSWTAVVCCAVVPIPWLYRYGQIVVVVAWISWRAVICFLFGCYLKLYVVPY